MILFILFEAIIGTIGVAHSLLLTNGTPWQNTSYFYIVLWVSSFAILLTCYIFLGTDNQFGFTGFPLNKGNWLYVVGGTAAMIVLASVMTGIASGGMSQSSLYVPQPHLGLAIGGVDLNSVVNDLFYQLFLVANTEEILCLALSQAFRAYFGITRFKGVAAILGIIVPRGGWGVLHAYVNYAGPMMWLMIGTAIGSGLIMSYCAYNEKVQSLIAAVLQHFGFNSFVVVVPMIKALFH